jgi:nitrogen fixation NifU-like protein
MSDLPHDFYTKEVYDHFQNPRHAGKLENYTVIGEVGNLACGDLMRMYLLIEKNQDNQSYIKDISFETYGCTAAIATSSMTTELAIGKTLDEALEVTKEKVIEALTDLPPQKVHCSILATDALLEAVYNYRAAQKMPISDELEQKHQAIKTSQELLMQRYNEWTQARNPDEVAAAANAVAEDEQ